MFFSDHKKLRLSFNTFHEVEIKDMPEYGEYCLLVLKDGRYTAGGWHPNEFKDGKVAGCFGRGTADTVDVSKVEKWHSLQRNNLANCLEDEEVNYINIGVPEEDAYSLVIGDFHSFEDGDIPKKDQFCLLILTDGDMAAGRWYPYREPGEGCFIYASALASHSKKKVWAWTALSSDDIFAREEERERERLLEEELNKNPTADPEKFKYGTDITVYYEKALEKLREKYPRASLAQMKKKAHYVIVPRHGQYIFGRDNGTINGVRNIREWTDGNTADEFIDFLYNETENQVKNSNPEEKFRYGMEIEVYLKKAYDNVKKDYTWLDKKMVGDSFKYAIKQVDGDWEFVRQYDVNEGDTVLDFESADQFIKSLEHEYQQAALSANPVVAEYAVPFGRVDLNGWGLEKYVFYKLSSGDYKVFVQAGDRTTGGSREFFITPYCFEADSYEEFLDRYLEIVPGSSFGMEKKDLLPNKQLKEFLGYGRK